MPPIGVTPNEPDKESVRAMAGEVLTGSVQITRFPTGLRHFVFEATSDQGQKVVVRVSRQEDIGIVHDSLFWSHKLRSLGVPLPKVLHSDATIACHPFPFVIMERLPGSDLCFVVGDLKKHQLRNIAQRLVEVQEVVAGLPLGSGFGFAPRIDGPFPHDTWQESVANSLARSRLRIRVGGILSECHADLVEAASEKLMSYFDSVRPTPFLHDITTKNVIVKNARLTGIVDVDDLCFGDPLFLIGLIRVALLANGHSAAYADAWVDLLRPNREQREALSFYTAMFCLDFMAELGHRFNRSQPAPVEKSYVELLQGLLRRHLPE